MTSRLDAKMAIERTIQIGERSFRQKNALVAITEVGLPSNLCLCSGPLSMKAKQQLGDADEDGNVCCVWAVRLDGGFSVTSTSDKG